jgi:pimeloyl-ACP methyl ester carboxylesterase
MKTPLLILHGAIGASSQFTMLAHLLSDRYEVHLFDFPGHGGKPMPAGPFSIPLFAAAAAEYIAALPPVVIFGYSMGGAVGMYLAKHYPANVQQVITLGTKFYWDGPTAEGASKTMDPERITAKVPALAKQLEAMHAPNDWVTVLHNTTAMLHRMGVENPLQVDGITVPVQIMQGDRDKLVTLEESISIYQQLPDARIAVLPGTPHPIEQVNPELVAAMIP